MNNAWTSCPVRALIAHDLCTNVILGLPFLKHNKIVIDHEKDTVIAKDSGFDLLNENLPSCLVTPPRQILNAKEKRNHLLLTCKQVLEELKYKCAERHKFLENNNLINLVTTFNHIALIRNTIERLTSNQELSNLEEKTKNDFSKIF